MSDAIKNYWNDCSDVYFSDVSSYDEIIKKPERAFPAAVYLLIQKYMGDLRGKRICVPSSGDNTAVFGFHLLGAHVTSCDIAENQIKNARKIADKQGWNIDFRCCDSMRLDRIDDEEYDLVYTSNGVHVWIDDMPGMYQNFYRVLKPGGYNVFFDTHPMIRPFDNKTYEVKIKKSYSDIGPFDNDPTYDWRTQDFVNAISSAGFVIKEMREFHSQPDDLPDYNYLIINENSKNDFHWPNDTFNWRNNPWAAFPQCLCMCSEKS